VAMANPKPSPAPRRAAPRRPAAGPARGKRAAVPEERPALRRWGWAVAGGVCLVVGVPLAVALVGEIGAIVLLALAAGVIIGKAWR